MFAVSKYELTYNMYMAITILCSNNINILFASYKYV